MALSQTRVCVSESNPSIGVSINLFSLLIAKKRVSFIKVTTKNVSYGSFDEHFKDHSPFMPWSCNEAWLRMKIHLKISIV